MQLSIYAHAVLEFYHLPVECYIDYVSRGLTKKIDVLPMEKIIERAVANVESLNYKN